MEPSVAASHSHIDEDQNTNVEPPSSPRHQAVLARWDPGNSKRPVIDEAPVFHPTSEEFENALAYIEKIRPKAESFGICRIIPPPIWSPPCWFEDKNIGETAKFPTRIQTINLLQNREPMKKKKIIKKRKNGSVSSSRKKPRSDTTSQSVISPERNEEKFGFRSGSSFSLKQFEKFARDFKDSYFKVGDNKRALSIEAIEGEYWRIIENPTKQVEVYYGADLAREILGSGTYKGVEMDRYITSDWNLKNLPRLPGSVLSFEQYDISGVLAPWLYVGMCFSSFCWHVEDHHLYSVSYHHFGEPKVWYGVPGSHSTELEGAMRKHLPDMFEEEPHLLHKLVTQFSPSILKDEGVPVYRTVQHSGEFIVTFPRAYHAGFNCGFNCGEAVNVAPVDWLPYGLHAVELYSNAKRKTSLSHDKLLLGAAFEAVKSLLELSGGEDTNNFRWKNFCGKNGNLTNAIEVRLLIEEERVQTLGNGFNLQRMEKDFDSDCEKECIYCLSDLHLSASGCKCSTGKYTCTKHANKLCSCEVKDRFILLRYTIDELSSLVRALEGEPEDLKTWASKENQRKKDAFDPNLEFQLDEELNTSSKTCDDASMIDFAAYVEPINLGLLVYGNLWCYKHTIIPKGFKSRVKFYNVQNPLKISYYISEIVDAGLMGPLFRVTLEGSQDVSFSYFSPQKCWEMVLQRVKEMIKQSSQEQNGQGLDSIDGLQMFGLRSPSIVQAIEALDADHRLVEYWNHKNETDSSETTDCSMSNSSQSLTKGRLLGVDLKLA